MRRLTQITQLLGIAAGKPAHGIRRTALIAHHATWGSLNYLVGLVAGVACIAIADSRVFRYRETIVVLLPLASTAAAALGPIIIATGSPAPLMLAHERGHWLQSVALGPLYFLIIGLPSMLHLFWFQRFRRHAPGAAYYRFYTEAWADAWAGIKRNGPTRG